MTAFGLSPRNHRSKAVRPRSRTGDRGVVLIAALWLLVLLGVVASGLIDLARSERRIARNIVAEAEVKALAEAAVTQAILVLLDPDLQRRWPLDGTWKIANYIGRPIEVAIQDELGRIDLNTASDDLLKGLFRSAGLREIEADAAVDRVIDWRDGDDLKRLHGAEREDYVERSRPYSPRNAAFESVEELGQVLGITPELLRRIAPALTVFSRRTTIDMTTAPRAALLALPGVDEGQARQIMMARGTSSHSGLASGGSAPVSELTERAFSVVARVEGQGGVRAMRSGVVRFTGDPNRPYWVHEWR